MWWNLHLGLTSWIGTTTSTGPSFLGPSRCGHPLGREWFILDRSEGLAIFAGVSSSVSCRFSVSLAEWALFMFFSALCFVILRLGASRVECSSLPHSLLLLSPCRFSYQSGLFSLLLPYTGVIPLVTLMYSFQLTQTAASMNV